MLFPVLKRLVQEDFPQQYKQVVGKIANVINPAIENIALALNNNLTFAQNMTATVATIPVTVDSNGLPINPITFSSKLPSPTQHIFVTRALSTTNTTTYVTGAPFVDWIDNSGTITINHVTGLPANSTFNLTMIVTI